LIEHQHGDEDFPQIQAGGRAWKKMDKLAILDIHQQGNKESQHRALSSSISLVVVGPLKELQ
jgi:hypothetical protein